MNIYDNFVYKQDEINNMEDKRKEHLKEIVGWIAKGLFNRSVKAAETIMKNDPRFKQAVIDAAKKIEKADNELQDYLDKTYGEKSPEEIEQMAKAMGMSVPEFIKRFATVKRRR
tara:strand:+ start:107 stop:448 length:342 start_codon:yes stop_codon:yes gene_type:complete